MIQKIQRGFTLIELLVVIAIIGLLAAVVLAALGSARSKGADAAVKASLSGARSQAELFASDNSNSFSGVCDAAHSSSGMGGVTGPGTLLGAASSTATMSIQTGTGGSLATGAGDAVTCNDEAGAWMIEAPLSDSTTGSPHMWCVDSTGAAQENSAANGGTTAC